MTHDEAIEIQRALFKRALEVVKRKRIDYSGPRDALGNFRWSEMLGVPAWKGAMVRMLDKVARLRWVTESGKAEVSDETLEDTVVDLINYAVLTYLLIRDGRP